MDAVEPQGACPKCWSMDAPILVVRGTGVTSGGLSLQCRNCQHERSARDHGSFSGVMGGITVA